jgi:hypothetical protein
VDVTKIVDLVTRIPKKLSLNFSNFSTTLYRFYKFAGKTRKHMHRFAKRAHGTCTKPTGRSFLLAERPLAGTEGTEEAAAAEIRQSSSPAARAGGGEAGGDLGLPLGGSSRARGGQEGRRLEAVGHGGSRRWGCSGDRGWPTSGRGSSLAQGGARGRVSSGRERAEQGAPRGTACGSGNGGWCGRRSGEGERTRPGWEASVGCVGPISSVS